jgi:hypothetical protein
METTLAWVYEQKYDGSKCKEDNNDLCGYAIKITFQLRELRESLKAFAFCSSYVDLRSEKQRQTAGSSIIPALLK